MARYRTRKRTIGGASRFNVKAADMQDGSISGVVRMHLASRTASNRLKGICAPFMITPGGEEIRFGEDSLFFYGQSRELSENYRGRRAHSLDLSQYSDRNYSKTTIKIDRGSRSKAGFLYIPVGDLGLSGARPELVQLLVAQAREKLPGLIGELERIEIEDTTNGRKAFASSLNGFPTYLREMALEAGSFYRKVEGGQTTTIKDKYRVPAFRIVSGGLPSLGKRR
jgi:hypothetical protein